LVFHWCLNICTTDPILRTEEIGSIDEDVYMKSSDASSRMVIFIKLVYLSSVILHK